MVTVDCMTYYERERRLRAKYFNETPVWEDPTGGTPYQWTPTGLLIASHTADPGDAGGLTTSESTYTGYSRTLFPRDTATWELINPQAGGVAIRPKIALNLAQNLSGGNISINAFSLGIRASAVDYGIIRSVLGSTLTVANNGIPQIPAANATHRNDSGGSGTAGGLYTTWEEKIAKYMMWGGQPANALPGMTINCPVVGSFIALCKSDPRTLVYPNSFAAVGARNATFEPTSGEWLEYARPTKNRYSTVWTYANTAGTITMANTTDIVWPAPVATANAGGSYTWVLIAFPDYAGLFHYPLYGVQLDTAITVPSGGSASVPTIPAGLLVLQFDTP